MPLWHPITPARASLRSRKPAVSVSAVAVTAGVAFGQPADRSAPSLGQRLQAVLSDKHDKEIWAVALPALVAMLLEPVMNALNAGLVGHLGTQQLSAVSLGSLAVSFCTFLFSFLLFLTVPEIAAAVVKKDDEEVSRIAAKTLWIAAVCGVTSSTALYLGAGAIVGALNPPEAAVAAYAIDYIKVRSLGIPAALLGFVATGVFRGFKDTRTPLFGAVASGLASLGLNVLFLYVLNMGVVGSAFATMAAQLISCGLLMAALLAGGKVRPGHLTRPPPLSSVLPTLKLGAVLGARNVISFGMVLYASTMCIRLGSAYQASFEVIRQVWILTIQFFECLNVAAQALCASYIGNDDAATARSVLGRLVVLGTGVGVGVGLGVWAAHGPLIAFFTKDPVVVAHVMATLPLICLCFPIDAAASIMDGSLLAAKQSNYMSAVQIVGSVVQYGVLSYLAGTAGAVSTFSVWGALKILSFARLIGGVSRNYFSPKSAYVMKSWGAAAGAAVAGAAGAAVAGGAAGAQLGASEAGPVSERERELVGASASGSGVASSSSSAFTSFASGSSSISSGGSGSSNVVPVTLQSLEEDVMVLAAAACSSATDMHPDMIEMHRRSSSGSSSSSCSQPAVAVAAVALGNGDGHLNGNGGSSSNGAGGMGHGRGGAEVGPEPAAAVVAGGGRTAAPPSAPAADATERA